jgi:hypothetical protein
LFGSTCRTQGFVAGANILDMAQIGIDQGLRVSNTTLISEAYGRVHAQMVEQNGIKVDGIKPDGSFSQHGGLLYNGDYGSVLWARSMVVLLPWALTMVRLSSGDVLALEQGLILDFFLRLVKI